MDGARSRGSDHRGVQRRWLQGKIVKPPQIIGRNPLLLEFQSLSATLARPYTYRPALRSRLLTLNAPSASFQPSPHLPATAKKVEFHPTPTQPLRNLALKIRMVITGLGQLCAGYRRNERHLDRPPGGRIVCYWGHLWTECN